MSEPIEISQENNDRFLAALQAGDSPALKTLVEEFGTEVSLHLETREQHGGSEEFYQLEIRGTPLSIAAWLKKETLAVFLVQQGAVPGFYGYAREGSFGWDSCSVATMERALTADMSALVAALMQGPHLINWSEVHYVDEDDWGSARRRPTLFENIRAEPEALLLFEKIGLFRGIVDTDTVVGVKPDGCGSFTVTLNDESLGTCEGMQAALDTIWVRAGLTATPIPYNPLDEMDEEPFDELAKANAELRNIQPFVFREIDHAMQF